jgi:hypothetical protein
MLNIIILSKNKKKLKINSKTPLGYNSKIVLYGPKNMAKMDPSMHKN